MVELVLEYVLISRDIKSLSFLLCFRDDFVLTFDDWE